MEKRKTLSKGRLIKSKLDISKVNIEHIPYDSLNRISKIHHAQEQGKKSITPTPSRLSKQKNILNKRTSDTPKLKIDDLEIKRRSVPNTQENLEAYYTSYIKALSAKLEKNKIRNTEIEEELKQMELGYKIEEGNMRKEIDRLNIEIKKIKREKIEQETSLMEENFRIRREHEDYKTLVNQSLNEIIPDLDNIFNDIIKKMLDISIKEQESIGSRLSLKDTASFSNTAPEIDSPRAVITNCFKEAIVLYSHKPENLDEIELNVGDRVNVFNSDELNEWWTGKVSDKIGKFPRNCVMLD